MEPSEWVRQFDPVAYEAHRVKMTGRRGFEGDDRTDTRRPDHRNGSSAYRKKAPGIVNEALRHRLSFLLLGFLFPNSLIYLLLLFSGNLYPIALLGMALMNVLFSGNLVPQRRRLSRLCEAPGGTPPTPMAYDDPLRGYPATLKRPCRGWELLTVTSDGEAACSADPHGRDSFFPRSRFQ